MAGTVHGIGTASSSTSFSLRFRLVGSAAAAPPSSPSASDALAEALAAAAGWAIGRGAAFGFGADGFATGARSAAASAGDTGAGAEAELGGAFVGSCTSVTAKAEASNGCGSGVARVGCVEGRSPSSESRRFARSSPASPPSGSSVPESTSMASSARGRG